MRTDHDKDTKQPMSTVFLSGSRKMSRLNEPVRTRLQNMIQKGLSIVVGDANGADKAMQSFLAEQKYASVIVFCSAGKCRNNVGDWPVQAIEVDPKLKGRAFYTVKDKAMAQVAEYGFILWDGESKGSLANAETLLDAGKKVALYHAPTKRFVTLKAPSDLTSLRPAHSEDQSQGMRQKKSDAVGQSTLPFEKAS